MSINLLPFFSRKVPDTIVIVPDKRLRKSSARVVSINPTTRKIINELLTTVKKLDSKYNPWLGMAAVQLGYPEQILVLKLSYRKYVVMINPELVSARFKLPSISTCYSVKGLYVLPRYFWIKVKFQDENGKYQAKTVKGGRATVLQQELEHLQGKMICD